MSSSSLIPSSQKPLSTPASGFVITPRLIEKPWGGSWLSTQYKSQVSKLGEAWLLSTLDEGESELDGRPLSEAIGGKLPFVVKIIDSSEPLSVQVHPNDEWARQLENSKGKTECWLILASEPDAGVYLGFKENAKPRAFETALKMGQPVDSYLEFVKVKRGDFLVVPAGTIHAIGPGVTLLEVQQASGITYRLWDWNRAGRELHVEKGLRVSSYARKHEVRRDILNEQGILLKHADFTCWINESEGEGWFIDLTSYEVYRGSAAIKKPYVFVR